MIMDEVMKEYIQRLLQELKWDLDDDRIIKFKHRKGLNITKDGIRIEKIFIVRETG